MRQPRLCGEVQMHRKHTAHMFGDLPGSIYQLRSQGSSMASQTDAEPAGLKARELPPTQSHHLMVETIQATVLPASRLPKGMEGWEEPRHAAITPRTAWSVFNVFIEVQKSARPRLQFEGSLRLSALFRR